MRESKPNKLLIRFASFSIILGLLLSGVAIVGFLNYNSDNRTYFSNSIIESIIKLKYQLLDLISGLVIIMLGIFVNSNELKKQDLIDESWNVKEPQNVRDLHNNIRAKYETDY